jgi:hypothetical protein
VNRRAVKNAVGDVKGITINTRLGYDLHRNTATTVSTITYPAGTRHGRIQAEIMAEIDVINVVVGDTAMTVTRRA